jgi:hypothetical protein
MPNPENIERAFFQVDGSTDKVEVHFNPETLQYTITNNLKNQGGGNATKQYVSDSTGKLTMDLIFDNTSSGEDIRMKSSKIAKLMEPVGAESEKAPPVVNFEWGLYKFSGMLESYKETIDYFSSDGVPLRSSINITMSSQDKVFDPKTAGTNNSTGEPNSAVPVTPGEGKGATELATKAGNPGAAKAIASSNGMESMRFSQGGSVELDSSISLKGPSGFASVGIGLDVGAGLDSNAGLNLSAGVSVGSNLSAGVSASAGAFSGLKTVSVNNASSSLKLDKFIASDVSSSVGIDSTTVAPGGSARLQGAANFKAEVGTAGEFKSAIEFDGG